VSKKRVTAPTGHVDLAKEAAIVGTIAEGTFDRIPKEALCDPEAFTDPRWRTLYGAAYALRHGNHQTPICVEAVNDFIGFHGKDTEFQFLVDPSRTLPWQRWPDLPDVDRSQADAPRGLISAYSLSELDRLYRLRKACEVAELLKTKVVSIAEAYRQFGELINGASENFDFAKADAHRFNDELLLPKPEPIILLDNKPICTAGNISVIYAKPKAGKTACVEAIIAASIAEDDEAELGDFLGFSASNPSGRALIHFDSEQSPYDYQQVIIRAKRRAHRHTLPAWLRTYCITDFGIAERRAFLRAEIKRAYRECGGVFAVIVDGIADFIPDVNDLAESVELVVEVHGLAIEYGTHLLLVLHENPNEQTQKTRGHLGSQLERKAESNIRNTKDADGTMDIYTEKSRHAHIPKSRAHRFRWDDLKSMHVTCEADDLGHTSTDESDLIEAIFDCPTAREQAGGLQWAEALDRLVALGLYKSRSGARRRFATLLEAGWFRKQGELYWPSKP
jgi:hypothetical protein